MKAAFKNNPCLGRLGLVGWLAVVSCAELCAQGIYAVTRRTRIPPAMGVFLPPVTNVTVTSLPLINTFPAASGGNWGSRGNGAGRPLSADAALEVARKTLEFQQRRAKEGSAYAQYDLGLRHLTGDGVAMDREEALRLLGESARQGNRQAARKLEELASPR